MEAATSDWVRISDAAELLGVDIATVRRWADRGKISHSVTFGGHRRFRRSDIETIVARQQREATA